MLFDIVRICIMSTITNSNKHSGSSTRILRECRLDNSHKQKQSRGNIRVADPQSRRTNSNVKPCIKKTANNVTSEPGKENSTTKKTHHDPHSDRNAKPSYPNLYLDHNPKTWFQKLLESPKKSGPKKILQTNHQIFEIPCPCKENSGDSIETAKENLPPWSENYVLLESPRTVSYTHLTLPTIYSV